MAFLRAFFLAIREISLLQCVGTWHRRGAGSRHQALHRPMSRCACPRFSESWRARHPPRRRGIARDVVRESFEPGRRARVVRCASARVEARAAQPCALRGRQSTSRLALAITSTYDMASVLCEGARVHSREPWPSVVGARARTSAKGLREVLSRAGLRAACRPCTPEVRAIQELGKSSLELDSGRADEGERTPPRPSARRYARPIK